MGIKFNVNNKEYTLNINPNMTLLDLLRDELDIVSVKKFCEEGECGVCTVLLNGQPVTSCLILAAEIDGCDIKTVEGLNGELVEKIKSKFIEMGSFQCGFCAPGMLITILALLRKSTYLNEEKIRQHLSGNLCRCSGYVSILRAVKAVLDKG